MKIAVTGATGFIGKDLVSFLSKQGHQIIPIGRDPTIELLTETLSSTEAVINLAGEPLSDGRWTQTKKDKIYSSRINGTNSLVAAMARLPAEKRPKILISTSAVGYYGERAEETLIEKSSPGQGFLPKVCIDWEEAALAAKPLGLRVVLMRLGVVLGKNGGALKKMPPVIAGNGKQWVSWIHKTDVIRFIEYSLKNAVEGAHNLSSSHPVRNEELTRELAKIKHFPIVIKAPAFAMKLALGEMSDIVLQSQKALPEKTLEDGFTFNYTQVAQALAEVFSKSAGQNRN